MKLIAAWLLLVLSGCSLNPSAGMQLTLRLPKAAPVRGPALSTMKCFGLVTAGGASNISPSQIGNRNPACLKMDGTFHGPYTYSELTSGVSVPLTAGTYSMQLIGFDGSANCTGGLSNLFSTSPEVYDVAISTSFTFPSTTTVTLDGSQYGGVSSSDLVPACPPQASGCEGYPLCDDFNGPQGIPVTSRPMNTGQTWEFLGLATGYLSFELATTFVDLTPASTSGTVPGLLLTDSSGLVGIGVTVYSTFSPGNAQLSLTSLLIANYQNALNYVYAYFTQDSIGVCTGGIAEMRVGIPTIIVSGSVDCATIWNGGTNSYGEMSLFAVATHASVSYGSNPNVFNTNSLTITSGSKIGMGTVAEGTVTQSPKADRFRASIYDRRN